MAVDKWRILLGYYPCFRDEELRYRVVMGEGGLRG